MVLDASMLLAIRGSCQYFSLSIDCWLLLLLLLNALITGPQASQYQMPIYITETGIADRSDANRATMIDQYMRAVSSHKFPQFIQVDCAASLDSKTSRTLLRL
jgi:hypothetical protein